MFKHKFHEVQAIINKNEGFGRNMTFQCLQILLELSYADKMIPPPF